MGVACCCHAAAVQVRIDKFTVEVDPQQLPGGTRYFLVQGEAIERFAQVRTGVLLTLTDLYVHKESIVSHMFPRSATTQNPRLCGAMHVGVHSWTRACWASFLRPLWPDVWGSHHMGLVSTCTRCSFDSCSC